MSPDDEYGLRDYLEAKFQGVDDKFDAQNQRLERIEQAGPRAGMWGGIGTMIGAAIVAVYGFFSPKT